MVKLRVLASGPGSSSPQQFISKLQALHQSTCQSSRSKAHSKPEGAICHLALAPPNQISGCRTGNSHYNPFCRVLDVTGVILGFNQDKLLINSKQR